MVCCTQSSGRPHLAADGARRRNAANAVWANLNYAPHAHRRETSNQRATSGRQAGETHQHISAGRHTPCGSQKMMSNFLGWLARTPERRTSRTVPRSFRSRKPGFRVLLDSVEYNPSAFVRRFSSLVLGKTNSPASSGARTTAEVHTVIAINFLQFQGEGRPPARGCCCDELFPEKR